MGCDIHMVLERRDREGKWVGVDTFVGHESRHKNGWNSPLARSRNYGRFSRLAGVRGDGPDALGVPEDASDTARLLIAEWDSDGHSHSWLPLADAARIFSETEHQPSEHAKRWPASHFFGVDESEEQTSLSDYRLVFWFDN